MSSKITNSLNTFYQLAVKPILTKLTARGTDVSFTLPASGWTEDTAETSDYKYYYDLTASAVTASDIIKVIVDYQSLDTAANCGLCPVCWSASGVIRFRSKQAPSAAISGIWRYDHKN